MKKLVLFCAALICAAAAVRAENDTKPFQIAKAVKLGRNINATTSYQSVLSTGNFAGSTELTETPESFECDANCQNCDETTGTCLLCAIDRYISENLCLTCPEKNYCDGEKAIPNCTDVSCLSGSVAEATLTGCCCMPIGCEGVSCKSGFAPVANATGCCCV